MRNRYTFGISDTTVAKANAAKGSRSRSTTGVMTIPTIRQATSAPLCTLAPASEIIAQREACASILIAAGMGSIRQGIGSAACRADRQQGYADKRGRPKCETCEIGNE